MEDIVYQFLFFLIIIAGSSYIGFRKAKKNVLKIYYSQSSFYNKYVDFKRPKDNFHLVIVYTISIIVTWGLMVIYDDDHWASTLTVSFFLSIVPYCFFTNHLSKQYLQKLIVETRCEKCKQTNCLALIKKDRAFNEKHFVDETYKFTCLNCGNTYILKRRFETHSEVL
ncbi:hypothetical protein [Capnocytophaga sp. oral taxon 878]|uniref:hypothetical protein n=1 Tax=Capnocytophaga sp. oral taxon 878 TaxID=1316596 RepID=UPI000D035F82|nr:hypothetical protein [Capnocytophaga sp. oral taxon 878]AVM51280.1 hypothetical protein C4H12_12865 [Capnocytophaga sp. oral taxon 878]